jgi:UTP--glucose-1-phosphate uridylyltransferase
MHREPYTTAPRVAILPAAGLGTRMRGADPGLPADLAKELYPVAGIPAIFHSLLLAVHAGAAHAVVVLRRDKRRLRALLQDPRSAVAIYPDSAPAAAAIERSLAVHLSYQETPLGECDALAQAWPLARQHAAGLPVAVVYPDNHVASCPSDRPPLLETLAETAQATGLETVALMDPGPVPRMDISDSGRVRLAPFSGASPLPPAARAHLYEVADFLPKGSGTFTPRFPGELRTCGIYAATSRWFAAIDAALAAGLPASGQELTDGVVRRRMLEDGERFAGVAVECEIFDIGNPAGYRRAIATLGRGRCRPEAFDGGAGPV